MPSARAKQKHRVPEWYVSEYMMDRALAAVVRKTRKLDRRHDIPYLAGYSKNAKTIYIDRSLPKSFRFRRRRINTDRFLILHEAVEKALMDQLGLDYLDAHQIATRAEQAAVRASGMTWHAYDAFMKKYVMMSGDKKLSKVPRDLDLKPYREERDSALLRRMGAAVEKTPKHKARASMGFRAVGLRKRVARKAPRRK